RLSGELPGNAAPKLSLAVEKIPVQAGLDLLRTLRNGIEEDLEAGGTVSGVLHYDATPVDTMPVPAETSKARTAAKQRGRAKQVQSAAPQQALTGSLVVDGFQLQGGALKQAIRIPKITLTPTGTAQGTGQELTTDVALAEGGNSPLHATVWLSVLGYRASLQGPASLDRLGQWAQVTGLSAVSPLSGISGDAVTLQLQAQGPWLPEPEPLLPSVAVAGAAAGILQAPATANDHLSGTMEFHNVKWKPDYLANEVQIARAVLTLGGKMLVWDSVDFAYGPVKGAAGVQLPLDCAEETPCQPRVDFTFKELDAGKLEAALLGARRPDTLLSSLLARFQSSGSTAWPRAEGTLKADALLLGPFSLKNVSATLRTQADSADMDGFRGEVLGGTVQGNASVTNGPQPLYALEGSFEKLSPQAVCKLLDLHCAGGNIGGDGKLAFAGFAGKDVASTAKGTMHFDWRRGTLKAAVDAAEPASLARFERWTGQAAISGGALTLEQNQVEHGAHAEPVQATITFGKPPRMAFGSAAVGKPQSGKPANRNR
ncbi:MAG TPA: hypothetical protein VGR64_06510, partial [Terracidiphilus sp.]|nr:hypothetical protein [Terracidiphilus sp.]